MVLPKFQIFWDVMLCHWVSSLWHYEGSCSSHPNSPAVWSFKTLITTDLQTHILSQKTQIFKFIIIIIITTTTTITTTITDAFTAQVCDFPGTECCCNMVAYCSTFIVCFSIAFWRKNLTNHIDCSLYDDRLYNHHFELQDLTSKCVILWDSGIIIQNR